ncbi:hypothetical protein AB0E96_13100 [Kitasatospora sp. NPDC036755]|uniref:hypothetical protein n=1 Tax=Kitasatospora sp. NPDC036755 TaxID=3154600 RepID=UPI0033E51D6C
MTRREATTVLLRAVRHPATRCLVVCLARAVEAAAEAAAEPSRGAAGRGCPGR